MRFFLGFITFVVAGGLIWGSYNLGAFKDVKLEKGMAGPFLLYGVRHEGAYYEISKKIYEIETWAKSTGLPCEETFGLYLEDPYIVENERLLSYGGCLTRPENYEQIQSKQNSISNLEMIHINQNQFTLGSFEGSPWIGPYKVYAKAKKFAEDDTNLSLFPALEIYRTDQITIQTTYLFGVRFQKK